MKWAVVIVLAVGLGAPSTAALAQQVGSGTGLPGQATLGATELKQPTVASPPTAPGARPLPNVSPDAAPSAMLPPASPLRTPPSPGLGTPSATRAPYGAGLGAVSGAAAGTTLGHGVNPTAPMTLNNPFAAAQGYATTTPAIIGNGVGVARGAAGGSRGGSSRTAKPYANYTPTSPVSPYMNLFRNDNGGAVNNYYSLVRPALDQRNTNQQTQREIQSLETTSRTQSQTLNQINQLNSQAKPAPTAPAATFQNLQNYYPNLDGSSP